MLNLYTQKTPRRQYLKCKYYKSVNILDNRDTGNEFSQLLEDNIKNRFFGKIIHKMWCEDYCQALFKTIEIERILNQ